VKKIGFCLNTKFHKQNKWVSALTPYLVNSIIDRFRPIIINSQFKYNLYKRSISHIISVEPGWAAPNIKFDTNLDQKKFVFVSDPHNKKKWLEEYVEQNDITKILSYYKKPFFYHFPSFPKEKFVHMPWAVPDEFINQGKLKINNSGTVIFGGKGSDAYDIRNWCRTQKCVKNFNNSGVENKKMTDKEFFYWLRKFDAIVAAGSSKKKYDLVTPKYFEIASAGSLLVGQNAKDLKELGFNNQNAVIFAKNNFIKKVELINKNPKDYLEIRNYGRELILDKHKVSDRLDKIESIF
jgi:hypothetical protein